jgi:hypothetical protein
MEPRETTDLRAGDADLRARDVLRRILPENQWAQFNETGILEVSGSRGTYHISSSDLTRVLESQTRRPLAKACLQLSVAAPVHDRIIAEFVLIQNDEDLYWRTANIFPAVLDNRILATSLVALLDVLLLIIIFAQLGR